MNHGILFAKLFWKPFDGECSEEDAVTLAEDCLSMTDLVWNFSKAGDLVFGFFAVMHSLTKGFLLLKIHRPFVGFDGDSEC